MRTGSRTQNPASPRHSAAPVSHPRKDCSSISIYANFDTDASPGVSNIVGNFTRSGGEAGTFGGERRPRGTTSLVADVTDAINSGRATPATFRKQWCRGEWGVGGYGRHAKDGFVSYETDNNILKSRAREAEATLEAVIAKGFKSMTDPGRVNKSFSGPIAGWINGGNRFSPQAIAASQWTRQLEKSIGKAIGKSFSIGNATATGYSGGSPLASGFVPFDLMPFVRTIYPVYTPLRNKLPRVPGQGEFHRAKILSSVTGSLPGGLGALQNDATNEFFGGAGFSAWPNPLPASGSQTAYDVIIPYKFFALTEATSWLAQFQGQGFDDLYGLASLVLLQEFMLCEEHDLLFSSSQSLAQPAAPTAVHRAAGSNETPITFTGTDIWVTVTAINYWGETAFNASNVTEVTGATSTSDVIDVTIATSTGAAMYVIYVGTGTAQPGRTGFFQVQTNTYGGWVGGVKFTIQGALPTTGNNPHPSDTGTGSVNNSESIVSILSGLAYNAGAGPYPNVAAGYYNPAVADILSVNVVTNALQQVYNAPGAYLADPKEIITSPTDLAILAASIRNETVAAFQFKVDQSELAGMTVGNAVAGIVNPITRSVPELLAHPYATPGTCVGLSYVLPQSQNNLGNVWENVMVQDIAQIGWPVIDPTFRQSILRIGTLFSAAPQYNFLLQGLQRSAQTPFA